MKEPKLYRLYVFKQIIVKAPHNCVLLFWKWYTNGWIIVRKIGIEKVKFSRSSRHIHLQFCLKNPSGVAAKEVKKGISRSRHYEGHLWWRFTIPLKFFCADKADCSIGDNISIYRTWYDLMQGGEVTERSKALYIKSRPLGNFRLKCVGLSLQWRQISCNLILIFLQRAQYVCACWSNWLINILLFPHSSPPGLLQTVQIEVSM